MCIISLVTTKTHTTSKNNRRAYLVSLLKATEEVTL